MKLEEMRAVHEAAAAGEWVESSGLVRIEDGARDFGFVVATCTTVNDPKAIAIYHNTYPKLLAVAEAAKAYRDIDKGDGNFSAATFTLSALYSAISALEKS